MYGSRTIRRLVAAGAASLVAVSMVGGAILAAVEDVAYLDGLWLAFTVVSTTGFGEGPATPAGMVVSMVVFVGALPGYLSLVAAAMMIGRGAQGSLRHGPRPMLVERDVRKVVRDVNRN